MDAEKYLNELVDVPDDMREFIARLHAAPCAYWRAVSMRRIKSTIVEVAENLSTHRSNQRYAVVWWSWRAEFRVMRWTSFENISDATTYRDRMFRIDLIYSDLRA